VNTGDTTRESLQAALGKGYALGRELGIALRVAKGLSVAHACAIVHRLCAMLSKRILSAAIRRPMCCAAHSRSASTDGDMWFVHYWSTRSTSPIAALSPLFVT
jgi:hypothetical protein